MPDRRSTPREYAGDSRQGARVARPACSAARRVPRRGLLARVRVRGRRHPDPAVQHLPGRGRDHQRRPRDRLRRLLRRGGHGAAGLRSAVEPPRPAARRARGAHERRGGLPAPHRHAWRAPAAGRARLAGPGVRARVERARLLRHRQRTGAAALVAGRDHRQRAHARGSRSGRSRAGRWSGTAPPLGCSSTRS